jgi:hypothetical protein
MEAQTGGKAADQPTFGGFVGLVLRLTPFNGFVWRAAIR